MSLELRLIFPNSESVIVQLLVNGSPQDSNRFSFKNPLTDKELEEIRWYLEDYGTRYAAGPDDERAAEVPNHLRTWGTALFEALFKANDTAFGFFFRFLQEKKPGRLLTVAAGHPAVLSLPWELLRPSGESFLFAENPRIAIRRGMPSSGLGRELYQPETKAVVHILFIVSRPEEAGFINPRTDTQAVLNALDLQENQRAEIEFLRPATLSALDTRLHKAPAVDIIHFDGQGAFEQGNNAAKQGSSKNESLSCIQELYEVEERGENAPVSGQGYLLFESESGGTFYAEASLLGELFHRQRVGLVVLSACQSAAMGEDDAMSGVAAQLIQAGIPAVMAMTHRVLVKTTEALFAEFYRSLFKGNATGTALDDARAALRCNPNRGIRLRGEGGAEEVVLELEDWFLPTLYQNGADRPLLSGETDSSFLSPKQPSRHNLPPVQESGFWGRSWELWQIERAFTVKKCRRLSVTGFGGQGKTALALEAGRWFLRIKLFQQVCFISFAGFQGIDPVGVAISTLATVLEQSLPDEDAAEAALKQTPALLILDNLESLADGHGLAELLDAAVSWSEAGDSRVLLTSRQPDFNHPDYPTAGSFRHQCLELKGLKKQDAVNWFDALYSLPPKAARGDRPKRDVLMKLFGKVDFHPLSIRLLAQQLKKRGPADVGERLEELLDKQPANREDRSLLASLELSLERLPEQCRQWLPRLGVFAGGGLEDAVKKVTGMEDYPSEWSVLRYHLERSGLMQSERLQEADTIWLRFHPTLAPALEERLGEKEKEELMKRYWQFYHQLFKDLYRLDDRNPDAARAIARHELPNLLRAAYDALRTEKEEASNFTDIVNHFLYVFGLQREYEALSEEAAQRQNEVGSKSWFLTRSNLGEQLWRSGQADKAEEVFRDILRNLKPESIRERCLTLGSLGRCYRALGRLTEAETLYRQELADLSTLEQDEKVKRQTAATLTDLGDALRDSENYGGAEQVYLAGLKIKEELGDRRSVAVGKGQLGTLYLRQNQLSRAEACYQEALALFRQLNEPEHEAIYTHQMGRAHQEAGDWQKAEQAYREAVRLFEHQGDPARAAAGWHQLAQICIVKGRPREAEQWYRKALDAGRKTGDRVGTYQTLCDLAMLLANDPTRIDESRSLFEEALAIKASLIWQEVLQSRNVEAALARYGENSINLITAIRRILNGERDEAALCEPLNFMEAAVIRAILEGIAGQG